MHTLTLDQRRSTPSRLLGAPGPSESEQMELLRIASRVPDHGALAPFRFLRISGEQRLHLGELLAQRKRVLEPDCDDNALAKERGRFASAPLIITVIGCYVSPHKIPLIEQQMTAGCVCLSLLQAAQAAGFGAQWLTGWAAYDAEIRQALGVAENEAIVGFIHIGSAREQINERPRPDPTTRLQDWRA